MGVKPVLFIVMVSHFNSSAIQPRKKRSRLTLNSSQGTSGCGKSTVSSQLASQIGIPFVDGDDLHPQANVEKMSRGEALDDDDRLPWLQTIRQTAWKLTMGAGADHQPDERVRQLAEVHETSTAANTLPADVVHAHEAAQSSQPSSLSPAEHRPACIIACSALKRSYRALLRGTLRSLTSTSKSDQTSIEAQSFPDDALEVWHIYLRVEPSELLRRMHARKGHFMKESMLQSQLQTLEEPVPGPDGEPNVLVVEATHQTPGKIVDDLLGQITRQNVLKI